MLYRDVAKIVGLFLLGVGLSLCIPLLLSVYYEFFTDPATHLQPHTTFDFLLSTLLTIAAGWGLVYYGRKSSGHIYLREGILSVVLIWLLTPAMAALPFYISGTLENPLCAYFEMVSGFTTTGATTFEAKLFDTEGKEIPIQRVIPGVIPVKYEYYGTINPVRDPKTGAILHEGIEAVGKALLFWRSFSQWLGGVGIVVLFVAVLPALGVGGKVLFKAETTGPIKDSLTPRVKETALQLWKIYVGLTIMQIILLMMTNNEMGLFDAVNITFTSLSTGGFGIKNTNIGAYANAYTDWVVILFMILGGTNFALYYFFLQRKFYRLYEIEFALYWCIILVSSGYVSWKILGTEKILLTGEPDGIFTLGEAIRHGTFQVVSLLTCTGSATVDYELWPYATQAVLIIVMFAGGMAGSTAGGIKTIRLYMLFKIAQYKVESLFRPETIRSFKLGDKVVDPSVAVMTLCFFLLVIVIPVIGTLLLIIDGVDLESSFSIIGELVNNAGMGFRMASPRVSCAFLSNFGLTVGSIIMIFGRLEFFPILAVLVPAFWKKNR